MAANPMRRSVPLDSEDKRGQDSCPNGLSDAAIAEGAASMDRVAARWIAVAVSVAMVNRKELRSRLRPEPDEPYFSRMLSGDKPSPLRTLWALRGERESIRAFCEAVCRDLAPSLEVRDRNIPTRAEVFAELVRDMSRGERGRASCVRYVADLYGITEQQAEDVLFGAGR